MMKSMSMARAAIMSLLRRNIYVLLSSCSRGATLPKKACILSRGPFWVVVMTSTMIGSWHYGGCCR